ncbi:phage tail spike protein [Clostridium botulinum]|uniref:phage tail spike protein n=1 Tax=Clostridium botulinum TaxID=1491 RepID=UPI0004D8E6B5|nr:phage tail spike protein [Clostridium botulinum]KEI01559.1 endopeptidase [Clostridium botulinum C/D str. BKT75002]KEI07893.1 endopeptidase [Clostridium botulinum C/D str. BKT2873]QPW61580.1 phage tail protein [Clostridium botulinum]
MIIVYDSKEQNFDHNGLVVLDKCMRCEVTEELNGLYELELEYPIYNNSKCEYLIEDNIIQVPTPFGLQLFRIYHKAKTLTIIKINARHIFYDLLDNLVEDIDIRSISGKDALKKAIDNLAYKTNFKYFSNINWKNNIYLDDEKGDIVNKNPIEIIFELIKIYGGELKRDRFNFLWLENIGQDNNVVISYGKNIKGIEEDLNRDSVITRIKPVGQDGLTLDEKYIDSPYINNYPHPKIKIVEFSDCNDYESLRKTTKEHYKKTKCDLPLLNYKVDFIELSKTEEYKDYSCLEKVYLGDIVTVRHKILKIDVKQKVIKYSWDCLRNKYLSIELGNFKENLNKTFAETDDNLDKLDTDIKDTNKRIKESEKRFKSYIEKTDRKIALTVEEIGKTNTKIEQTEKKITLEVNNKIANCNSKIEQNAENISLVVDGGEVNGKALVSAINMSNRKIDMSALNINLNGYVTFRNLERGETIIDGGCINTKTIDADEIGARITTVSKFIHFNGHNGLGGIGLNRDNDLWLYSNGDVIIDARRMKFENGDRVATREWVLEQLEEIKK